MSAHPQHAIDRRRLRERVGYFFRSRPHARGEVIEFSRQMSNLGQVAIIGGMLRNLFLEGTREFVSDVDFVIDCASTSDFEREMRHLNATRNRFGGFAINLGRWNVDIWHLQRTWAAVEGHVAVQKLDDLVKVTFFNWDQAVYQFSGHKLTTAREYFHSLSHRLLEINLAPNPNPLGNAIRALRYGWRWDAKFGPRLAEHVLVQLNEHGWDRFLEHERVSFAHRILDRLSGDRLLSRLREHGKAHADLPFHPNFQSYQTTLELDERHSE